MDQCQEICVLVRQIVDSARVSGCGCEADVKLNCEEICACSCAGPCRCTDFISASAGPGVTLRCAAVEPHRSGRGVCVRAEMAVPVTVLIRTGGRNISCSGELCLHVEGAMRGTRGSLPELVAQANVLIRRGRIINGCAHLWIDYQGEIFGICQRAVRIPALGDCRSDCDCGPFFNLPLYPGDYRSCT